MTTTEMGYNRKLEGTNGELYKYGEGLFGVYTMSTRTANKVAKLEGARRRQFGDWEQTYSVPESHYSTLVALLKIKNPTEFKKD